MLAARAQARPATINHGETLKMRYLYIALITLLVGMVIVFKVQNFESATVTLFSMSATMPVAVLVFLIYVAGMLTGGLALKLFRTWLRGAAASNH